jgi:hypothetical protein
MKNKVKKVILHISCILLAVLLVAVTLFGWYFPRFLSRKEAVTITPKMENITMMSCNLRCLTPLDLGKRSWFYRADLLLSDIAAQQPGIIGFQEATRWQYDYMVDVLTGYDSVIDYRDNSIIA